MYSIASLSSVKSLPHHSIISRSCSQLRTLFLAIENFQPGRCSLTFLAQLHIFDKIGLKPVTGSRDTATFERRTVVVMPQKSWVGDEGLSRPATPRVCDFTNLAEHFYARDDRGLMRVVNRSGYRLDKGGISIRRTKINEPLKGSPVTNLDGKRKQQRARARRRLKKGVRLADEAFAELYKPLEDWDEEELARGRPRDAEGGFRGRAPQHISREIHERAMEKFKLLVRNEMNAHSLPALKTIQMVLESDELDARGRPIVPASTKMEAAKFLLEHIVGKPTQPTSSDISIRLQGILGTVMVNPMEVQGQYTPAHTGSRELIGGIYDEDEEDEGGDD